MKFIRLIILFIGIITISSCDNSDDYVPYVRVDFYFDLYQQYNRLTYIGYKEKFDDVGYAGIIVSCEWYDETNPSLSKFSIYDACCTYEMDSDCSVKINDNNLTATCPCCGTEYSLESGFPIGDSLLTSIPLKTYNYQLLQNRLYIRN